MQTAERIPPELASHTQYRNVRKLGEGGMGAIYLGDQPLLKRQVVLKVISPELASEPGAIERFIREMMACTSLNHENIARAYTAEQIGDLLILVMEYVPGKNLDEVVKAQGPLDYRKAIDYIRQSALGLAHAHAKGLTHRDIKPSNLMLSHNGQIKILDFGLVKADGASPMKTGRTAATGLTGSNTIMGTPDFMSPEQIQDAGKATASADIYSLGGTFFYLLTGEPPFTDPENKLLNIYLAHLSNPPRRVDGLRPDVPRDIADLIQKMLAKSPAQRPLSAQAIADQLSPNRVGAVVKTGSEWLETDEPATAAPSTKSKPKFDTLPEMKASTVNSPKPPSLEPWMLEGLSDTPKKRTSPPIIVAPKVRKPSKHLKPILISLGGLVLVGAGIGGFFYYSDRQTVQNAEHLREIRTKMEPLLAGSDVGDSRKKWDELQTKYPQVAADPKLNDLKGKLEGLEKDESVRLAKWTSLFNKLRSDSKSLDDADFRNAIAGINSISRTKAESDALKGLEESRTASMHAAEVVWDSKLKPILEQGEALVAESRNRSEDVSLLQKMIERIVQFQSELQDASKDLPARLTSQKTSVDRLRQTLRDRSASIETGILDIRGLDKLTAALKANRTGADWTNALTIFLDENPRSDYASGFRKVIQSRLQWEAPIEWAVLKEDIFKVDPWTWLDENRATRLNQLLAFFKKYASAMSGTDFLPARDVLLLEMNLAAQQQLPQHREQLAKVFDNPALTNVYQFEYAAKASEKNFASGVYFISEDQTKAINKGLLNSGGVTIISPLMSEGDTRPKQKNFKALGIAKKEDGLAKIERAKHSVLAERLAKDIRRSTESDWLATIIRTLDAIVEEKEVDPILRSLLLRRTLAQATNACPESVTPVRAKIVELEKMIGKTDPNWLDPGDLSAEKLRVELRAYFRGKPSFTSIRDEVKIEREKILTNLRRPVPTVVGYLIKPAASDWQCRLAEPIRSSADLVTIAVSSNGTVTWQKVGTLQLGQPRLLNGNYADGQLVFLKKD